ncbi:MAG: UDP-N-acetylglucosamine 2-epimerase (hydrolyzing) [Lachnospiraceae bacterium]|nr:UDP-N-acetylglucosamine 2-epimerase (hydrolyzing) [Lachnospiraceae bacterium]
MKTIAVITSTRAEYGLLYPVISRFRALESEDFRCSLLVTGTHLSGRFGNTVDEIEKDGIRIDERIVCSTGSANETDIAKNISDTIEKFTACFSQNKYDAVMVLGDRYEILGVVISAVVCRTPVFHIGGGDISEGAIDDVIRHSITKMSYLHFPSNGESRQRIIQLGEDPERVFNVGSTSIDNILNENLMTKEEALESVGLSDCDFIICTYHPETIDQTGMNEVKDLVGVFSGLPLEVIVTKSNSDLGGEEINRYLDEAGKMYDNIQVYASLGRIRYLSLMKYAKCVVGNSSSGIVETPAMHIPTVNIGDRQRGRLRASSVFDCRADAESIRDTIGFALSEKGQKIARECDNPYGDGHAAERIVEKSISFLGKDIDLKKQFYNISKE